MELGDKMSRKIEDLHPLIQPKAFLLIKKAKEEANLDIIIYRTLATWEEQDAIYAQGRTKPGIVVTNARGGESYHNYSLAFDFAILKPESIIINWDGKCDVDGDLEPDYKEVGKIGEDIGFEWGARFTSIKGDLGHLQMSFGLTIRELQIYYLGGLRAIDLVVRMGG